MARYLIADVDPAAAELRARRLQLRLSQQEVADRAGVHQSMISEWETGHNVTLASLRKWAMALGLDVVLVGRRQ